MSPEYGDNHQGGILPADNFPFCASLSRRLATKTGFFIPSRGGGQQQSKGYRNMSCNEEIVEVGFDLKIVFAVILPRRRGCY